MTLLHEKKNTLSKFTRELLIRKTEWRGKIIKESEIQSNVNYDKMKIFVEPRLPGGR